MTFVLEDKVYITPLVSLMSFMNLYSALSAVKSYSLLPDKTTGFYKL